MMESFAKKKPTNLRLIEIINSQKINDIKVIDPTISKSIKAKANDKSIVKGKKIDNKTLKIRKKDPENETILHQAIQLTNYNTNTDSISIIETLPFRQRSKHNKSRNQFSEATHSICTFDVNQQIEKGRRFSYHNRRASDIKVDWNKQNSRSHSRNSLGFDRRMSYARKIHNRSCNDMEPKQYSKRQSREKRKAHHLSCTEERTNTISPDRKKRTPKKHRKTSSQISKNPTFKDVTTYKKSAVEKNKKKIVDAKISKKKQIKIKKQIKKRGAELKQGSEQQEPEYPVSKYVSNHKKSKQISQNQTIRNSICQYILQSNNSSLIKSLETSNKWIEEDIDNNIKFIDIGQSSLNLKQIRKFEQVNKISEQKLRKQRKKLEPDITESYPELEKVQIQFLSSIIFLQRWWRSIRKIRREAPDQNLTEMIKSILNDAIKSQQISPSSQLAETIKPKNNDLAERKRFFENDEGNIETSYSGYRQKKQFGSPMGQFTINIGDLDIPESRVNISPRIRRLSSPKTILQNQVFPPFELLEQQRKDTLKIYSDQMDMLEKNKSFESSHEQRIIKEQMRKDLKQIDKNSRQIQKGYLTYLNCLRSVKTTPKTTSLLRKVNSSEGLMFDLYKKVFKMEDYLQESQSIQDLAKKVLIRRQWLEKSSPIVHFGSDPSSPVNLSQFLNQKNNKQKLDDFMGRSAENIKKKTNNILSLNQILQQYRNQGTSQQPSEDYESEIMATLLKEGINQEDEIKINEVIDMVLQLIYLQFAQDIDENQSIKIKISNFLVNRHIPGIDCSDSAIKYYLNLVIEHFLSNHKPSLVCCLNTPIGFTSSSILKLMRQPDFVPPDIYVPPVEPKTFLIVQKLYFNRIDLGSIYKTHSNLVQQLINVHNKAVYECFLSEIELLKPNGQNGVIHLWDPPRLTNHSVVLSEHLYITLMEALGKVMKYCSFKSGLILQNWVTRNARELEKAYEQNEQRIVSMISSDLEEEQTKWSDLDEFLLETRLDVDLLVLQWIIIQATKEISRI